MTNIYAHISDGDAPKSQHVTEVSFVDEKGAHINIGAGSGGGIAQVAHDNSLAGDGTSTSPLKLGDSISAQLGDTERSNQLFQEGLNLLDERLLASPLPIAATTL